MTRQIQTDAKGNAPDTGSPGPTPPPTRPVAPDLVSRIRAPQGGAGYGQNSSEFNPSSIDPSKQLRSPLGENLKASVTDEAIDRVIKEGTARRDDSITGQLRKIADGNVADHPAMKSPNMKAGTYGTLPQKLGATVEQPVRKPD